MMLKRQISAFSEPETSLFNVYSKEKIMKATQPSLQSCLHSHYSWQQKVGSNLNSLIENWWPLQYANRHNTHIYIYTHICTQVHACVDKEPKSGY